jgi:hypothetical protein
MGITAKSFQFKQQKISELIKRSHSHMLCTQKTGSYCATRLKIARILFRIALIRILRIHHSYLSPDFLKKKEILKKLLTMKIQKVTYTPNLIRTVIPVRVNN